MTQNVMKNHRHSEGPEGRLNPIKYCIDCEHSKTHQTGSQIWLSCKFQDGWRDINAICNLPEGEPTTKQVFEADAKPDIPHGNSGKRTSPPFLYSPSLAQNLPREKTKTKGDEK